MTTLLNTELEVIDQAIRKEKEVKVIMIAKYEIKLSFFETT